VRLTNSQELTKVSDDSSQPLVDVVIPLYNEARNIQSLCEALRQQQARPFRVILVDNGSTDNTVDLAQAYFPVYHCSKPGSYAARNYGLEQGTAPYILFIDGDCNPDAHWVERMATEFDRGADLVAGHTIATPQGTLAHTQMGRNLLTYFVEYISRPSLSQDSLGSTCLFPTCNVGYRRRVFETLGAFPVAIGGDLAFSQYASQQGFSGRICHQARINHISETTGGGIIYKFFLYSVQFRVSFLQWVAALLLLFLLPMVALIYFLIIYSRRSSKAKGIGISLSHFALFETLHLIMTIFRILSINFAFSNKRVY
jgi:glycosyltransferase involved in cell wall biosynthesis